MSTYYAFHCSECKESGGFLSRQMWGAGNFDIVDTFKFLMLHGLQCGPESVGFHSEHDESEAWTDVSMPGAPRLNFLERTRDIFPRSDDWNLIGGHADFGEARKAWQEQEVTRAEKGDE